MSQASSLTLSTSLIGLGVMAWAWTAHPLANSPELAIPVNPLGIKRSPYGEVIAMAMQGPIENCFEAGMPGADSSGSKPAPKHSAEHAAQAPAATPPPASWTGKLEHLLVSLDKAVATRNNPKAASETLKRHLRRQAENKLRFAYQLDPSHYANYNALHFFLTEPAVGTQPELTPSAAKLAAETVDYCLQQKNDPRPALTAAAACTNMLHLMFVDQQSATPKFTPARMRATMQLLDQCLARFHQIAQQWDESNQWNLLSPQRLAEIDERIHFVTKIRNAAEQAVQRFEQAPAQSAAPAASTSPSPAPQAAR